MNGQIEELGTVTTGVGSSTPVGKVLVVDDEPELRSVLVESLQRHGYEATGCGSGRHAIAELLERDFDLLLTDLMMPEMDGIALLKNALEIDPHLVGIIVTGQGTIQTAVDAMQIGAFDYVLKPFRMQTLLPVLTRAMNVRHLRLENVHLRETVAIYGLSQTIAFTLDPKTVLSKLADAALQQSDADEVSVLLPTNDGKELYVAMVRGEKRERLLGERVPLEQSIASWVARERTPLILNGEVHDERFVALWPRPEIRSAVSVPMQVANKLVGIINLNVTNRLRPFTLGQMKALTILAGTAAAALESASLYTQVLKTEEKYRSIFENATEGLFQSTSDGRLLTANPAFARILGYDSPEDMIATITDVTHQLYVNPEDRTEAGRLQDERGALEGFEFEAYRKDGEKIWLSLNRRSVRNQLGEGIYFEGSVENITERKLAEDELKRSEERYRDLVENAHDLIYEHDLEGNYTASNKAGKRITGYSLEETLKLNLGQTVAPDYLEKAREMLRRKLAGESVTVYDLVVIGKDGRRVPVEVNTRLVLKDGVPVGVQGIARDITERRRVEEIQVRRRDHALFRADVSAALAMSGASLQATLESCATAMVQHLGAAFARIWTLNHEENVLELQVSSGMYTHIDGPHSRVPVGAFKIGKIALERAPHITNEVRTDPRVGDQEWARREGMVAFAGYPLILENRVLGVMAMFSREELADDTLDALASVADLISHGIERKRVEEALRDSEARKRAILESSMDCIVTMDHEGRVVDWNPAAEKTFGYTQEEAIHREMALLIIPLRFREQHRQGLARFLATGEGRVMGKRLELSAERRDGTELPIELTITRIESKGEPMFTGYLRDITERKKAENRLSAQYTVSRALAESNTIGEGASRIIQAVCESLGWEYGSLWTVDRGANVLRCSQTWQSLGADADEFEKATCESVFAPGIGLPGRVWNDRQPMWIADVVEDTNFPRSSAAATVGLHGACAFPIQFRSEILGVVEFLSRSIREPDPDLLAMMVTIGSQIGQFIARKRAEEALVESEEQLRQSQKLEAIGQLAGGVAHDFNNLLTVIGGYSSILLNKLDQTSPHRVSVEEIKKASDRAGGLTRQLLAFSRKQILQPKVLDLNVVVSDLDKMVRRLIGEDIDLLAITDPNLGKVKADPGQIEQVLLNLIVNARDAMPGGGKLTIETANAVLSADYALSHGAAGGPYVMLAVSDTGCGMDSELEKHVFEPFFTTKVPGKGTGLGLATVYGIVKQSEGHIWLYSELGKGTSFKIYLPCVDELVADQANPAVPLAPKGTETLLLVEDEEQVRRIVQAILEQQGYDVLPAANGEEALKLAELHGSKIDLLLTDVVMPQMSGRELAEELTTILPQLKVLYMSGYTDDAIVRHGLLDASLSFIQKPFDAATAARKVREVLDLPVEQLL